MLAFLLTAYNASSQSTRLVLAEEFTQASCPPCATQNPGFNNILNANSTKVVAIKYQTDWPGDDPMNVQTAALVDQRVAYYHPDSVGVPYAVMDGVPQTGSTLSYTGSPTNVTAAKINNRYAVTSPFTINVTHSLNAATDSISITVDITCTQDVTGSLVAQVVIIERDVLFCEAPGTNGEEDFEGVMRDMLPNGNGTALAGTWTNGQTQQLTFNAKVRDYVYDKNELAVVAFIQDQTPCHWPLCSTVYSVLQAGYSGPQPVVSVDSRIDCGALGNPDITCGTSWNPSVNIKNVGTVSLTSAEIAYTIDGVAQTAVPWTGNLAPLGTAVVAVPAIASVTGQRELSFQVVNPNGQPDVNPGWDVASVSYYDYGTTGGSVTGVAQGFTTSTFPPAMWRNVNPNNGAGWLRDLTGFNAPGSALMYFWGSGNGQIDELWLPSYDFSGAGITTAQIDFDLAACQYNNGGSLTNDRMQVQYSTDCGANWTTVFNEAGATLAHGNPSSQSDWSPSSAADWHHITAQMPGAVGQSNVFIKFKATSNNGNNCYLDNINIQDNFAISVPEVKNTNIVAYPNPSNGQVYVKGLADVKNSSIVVTNSLGAVVRTISLENNSKDVYTFDLSNEAKGIYDITVISGDKVITSRVTLTE